MRRHYKVVLVIIIIIIICIELWMINTHTHTHTHTCIYMRVCVCVCVWSCSPRLVVCVVGTLSYIIVDNLSRCIHSAPLLLMIYIAYLSAQYTSDIYCPSVAPATFTSHTRNSSGIYLVFQVCIQTRQNVLCLIIRDACRLGLTSLLRKCVKY